MMIVGSEVAVVQIETARQRVEAKDRSVADQRVDTMPVTFDRGEHALDVIGASQVAAVRMNVVRRGRGFFQKLEPPTANEDRIALVGELSCQRSSNTGPATGQ
jgi:hypothetical protein